MVGQELLLGYLMNVLDEDEVAEVERALAKQPKLRGELARLQKRISPLDVLFDSVEPPSDLAQRTCDNIWTTTQNENYANNLHIFPIAESNTQTNITEKIQQPETTPPPPTTITCFDLPEKNNFTYNLEAENSTNASDNNSVDVNETNIVRIGFDNPVADRNNCNDNIAQASAAARLSRRRSKQQTTEKQTPIKKSIFRQLIISAVIGIALAIIIYPAIGYIIGQVTQLVVRQKVQQLDNSVEVYAQLSEPSSQTSPEEINLTRYGWQELIPSAEHIFVPNDDPQFIVTKILDNENSLPSITNLISANHASQILQQQETINVTNSALRDYIFLGQSGQSQSSVSFLSGTVSDHVFNFIDEHDLILNLPQSILVSDGLKIRPAVGQSILIQNGRVFFRVLPQSNNQQK
ncbi:MAG: hypothetical protein LBT09_04745 [Planctomycetaceae bacterium]|nr:hypothetical protein [Planctomycetaceae bacterium]